MKTIGELLKEARIAKGFSRNELGEMSHIKVTFIEAIENGRFGELPPFATTLGFVKSISHFLDMDENQAISVFRRDYPPKLKGSFDFAQDDKKKEIGKKVSWGPRMTFLVGVLVVVIMVLGYLGFQYRKFNSAPYLVVDQPTEGETLYSRTVEVKGKTEIDATVVVNNQPVLIDGNGNFDTQVDVNKDKNQIVVTAKSRSGKESVISRTIRFAQ